jgi:hypothetical protein
MDSGEKKKENVSYIQLYPACTRPTTISPWRIEEVLIGDFRGFPFCCALSQKFSLSKVVTSKLASKLNNALSAAALAAVTAAAFAVELASWASVEVMRIARERELQEAGVLVGGVLTPPLPSLCTFTDVDADCFTANWTMTLPEVPPRLDEYGEPTLVLVVDQYELEWRSPIAAEAVNVIEISVSSRDGDNDHDEDDDGVGDDGDDDDDDDCEGRSDARLENKRNRKRRLVKPPISNRVRVRTKSKSSVTVTDLTPYTVYRTRVRAHARGGGWSDWGPQSKVLTLAIEPDAPTIEHDHSLPSVRGTSCEVHWSTSIDNGSSIDRYEVAYRRISWSGDARSAETPEPAGAVMGSVAVAAKKETSGVIFSMRASITGLSTDSTYETRVRAHNQVGWSAWSGPFQIRTTPW